MNLFNKNQNKSESENEYCRDGSWNYYTRVFTDGQEALVEYNKEALDEKVRQKFSHSFRIVFHVNPEHCNSFGIAFPEERELVKKQEASLVANMSGVKYILAGIMMYGTMIDLVFQVEDRDIFINAVNQWRKEHKEYRVEGVEKKGWSYFERNILPDEYALLQISNRTQIASLVNSGNDPSKEYRLLHSFTGKKNGIESVCEQFKEAGFDEVSKDGSSLVLAHYAALDYYAICELTKRLKTFCIKNDVEYAGWRTDPDAG